MTENDIVNYNIQQDAQIKKITEPLKTAFSITEFWHYTIRPDGTLTYLANHPEISEYYWGSHLYKMCPLFKHPRYIEPQLIPSNAFKDKGYEESQGEIQDKFSMQLPFSITLKQGGVYHGFGFSTRNPEFPLDSVCMNNLARLNEFCTYFSKKTLAIETKLLEGRFNIGKQLGPLFHTAIPLLRTPSSALQTFHRKLTGQDGPGKVTLSRREKQSLALFLQGDTCKEIGEKLNLSTRTIETYVAVLKNKLQCHTKSELFKIVQELDRFGLL